MVRSELDLLNSSLIRSSLIKTFSLLLLGTSIPTVPLPGTGATTRIFGAFIARARSSARLEILETLMPGPGSNSYRVITGPVPIVVICPKTPKSPSLSTNLFAFAFSSDSAIAGSDGGRSFRRTRKSCLNLSSISIFIISSLKRMVTCGSFFSTGFSTTSAITFSTVISSSFFFALEGFLFLTILTLFNPIFK